MKSAVLLVSFGTSYKNARENSLECIDRDLREAGGGIGVYQAYTSGMIIKSLSIQNIHINTVEAAVREILNERVERLYVIPTHMIWGSEFQKIMDLSEQFRPYFKELKVASPVLAEREDCDRLIPVLKEMLQFRTGYEYILMGHGTFADANVRYQQMNEALIRAGLFNVRIASVEAKPDLTDAIADLRKRQITGKVKVHSFMVVAGDHARNDMAGEENSYVTCLREAGYKVEAVVKGLGEYPQFRNIYVNKFKDLLERV